jgi:hypothetical protein
MPVAPGLLVLLHVDCSRLAGAKAEPVVAVVASRYRYFGKLIAAATRSSTTAKYDAVIARLLAIIPSEQSQPAIAAVGTASSHVGRLGGLLGSANNDSGSSTPQGPAAAVIDRSATTSSSNTVAAAAGVLERMLKGGAAGAASSAGAAADSSGILVRSGEHDKVTSMCFLPPPDSLSAAACVWWAVCDSLEFYSDATQSTTSFAAAAVERAAITALTVDSAGNVWGGTAKGTVFMRPRMNWQQVGGATSCVDANTAVNFDGTHMHSNVIPGS